MADKVLMLASVASMIDQFNMPNIRLLKEMGCCVNVACNFIEGNTCSDARIAELKTKLSEMNVDCYQIDFARGNGNIVQNVKAYNQALRLMQENRYLFVHCHSPIGGVFGRIAGRRTGIKILYTAHGFHFYRGAPLRNWLVYYPIEKFLSRCTDALVTINKEDYALAKKKFHAKSTYYIPGIGVEIEKIQNAKANRNKKRAELGLPEDAMLLLSVGELSKRKNHEVVLRALAQMNNANLAYAICGKGALDGYLKKLAEQLGVGDKIHFLGFRTDIIEICKAADIFVFPSLQEGLPVALMEAMACGLPVACSNIRGNVDLIEDGVNGCLFSPADIPAICAAIAKIFKEPEFAKECGKKNMQIVQDFSLEKSLSAMAGIYKSISGSVE